METKELFRSAFDAIVANRLRSSLTVLSLVVGVVAVIVLISLVSGLKNFVTGQIEGFGSNLIFVIPGKVGGSRSPGGVQVNRLSFRDGKLMKKALQRDAEVSTVAQKVSAVKYAGKVNKDASVFGVEINYPKVISALKIDRGRFFSEAEAVSGRKVALIGPAVAGNLFGSVEVVGRSVQLGNVRYEVIGVTGRRGSLFGIDQDNSVYIPLPALQKQFGVDRPNTIYVSAKEAGQVPSVQARISNELSKRLPTDDFTVATQEQALATISQVSSILSLALGGIAAISLFVGGIGITNIMLVSVTERTKEIGLMKALGARQSDIRGQFLAEALMLSGFGGFAGIILGVLASLTLNFLVPTSIVLWPIALAFGFSVSLGVIFGVAPAIKAARLDPIQALRYE